MQICAFRKHVFDANKGKQIFLDEDPVEQNLALDYYTTLRSLLSEWSKLHPKQNHFREGLGHRADNAEPSPFVDAFYRVFGGDPALEFRLPRNGSSS